MKKLKLFGSALMMGTLLSGCMNRMAPDAFWHDHFVFVSARSGANDIYLADFQGRHVRALTSDAADDASPRVTIDGKIVFASRRTGTWQIYLMNWDGSGVTAVTQDPAVNNYRPYPSPDGRIIFISDRFVKPQIMSVNADGSDLRRLSDGDFHYDHPVVNDDGLIYFTSSRSSKWEIWRMAPDGGQLQQLTHSLRNIREIAIIPNTVNDKEEMTTNRSPILTQFFRGQPRLLYTVTTDSGNFVLQRMNLDGTDQRAISTNQRHMDRSPVLWESGEVLFTSDRNGSTDVWSMSPDGFNLRPVIADPAYDSTS